MRQIIKLEPPPHTISFPQISSRHTRSPSHLFSPTNIRSTRREIVQNSNHQPNTETSSEGEGEGGRSYVITQSKGSNEPILSKPRGRGKVQRRQPIYRRAQSDLFLSPNSHFPRGKGERRTIELIDLQEPSRILKDTLTEINSNRRRVPLSPSPYHLISSKDTFRVLVPQFRSASKVGVVDI